MNNEIKLRPCPFCGNDEIYEANIWGYCVIHCDNCGADVCFNNENETEKSAAEMWNRRVVPLTEKELEELNLIILLKETSTKLLELLPQMNDNIQSICNNIQSFINCNGGTLICDNNKMFDKPNAVKVETTYKFKDNWFEMITAPHTAVHCDTEEKAEALLIELWEKNIYFGTSSLTRISTHWYKYKSKTCYDVRGCYYDDSLTSYALYGLSYADKAYYESSCRNIIEFDDLVECCEHTPFEQEQTEKSEIEEFTDLLVEAYNAFVHIMCISEDLTDNDLFKKIDLNAELFKQAAELFSDKIGTTIRVDTDTSEIAVSVRLINKLLNYCCEDDLD